MKISCPNCIKEYEVDNSFAGLEVECAECYQKFIAIMQSQEKKCPYCAELIKVDAVICKHCKSNLSESPTGKRTDKLTFTQDSHLAPSRTMGYAKNNYIPATVDSSAGKVAVSIFRILSMLVFIFTGLLGFLFPFLWIVSLIALVFALSINKFK